MKPITVVLPWGEYPSFREMTTRFSDHPAVESLMIVCGKDHAEPVDNAEMIEAESMTSGKLLNLIFEKAKTEFVLFLSQSTEVAMGQFALERFITVMRETNSGMAYADYAEFKNGQRSDHPVNDYQLGSIRDNFDFGPLMFFGCAAVRKALKKYSKVPNISRAGLYDLRLKLSVDNELFHIQEYLYTKVESDLRLSGEKLFDYVDPRNRIVQIEMEETATRYLKTIGAYLKPVFKKIPKFDLQFPVEASVIIPVRNRERTIGDAVKSVLSQEAGFSFNLIIVDNHSTDNTTEIVRDLAVQNPMICRIIPERNDLGIGGCWNEAVFSDSCGRYAVQLDSDDLYSSPSALQKIVDTFRSGQFAMVIGSYQLVNSAMEEIPPGLIDHKEWTPKNGRNNALRINGLGAPRAFNTALLRHIALPNVSYGEDYAVALRLSRDYQIGRVYESLYLCRRWEGNTDSALPIDKINRNDWYKDKIRTIELMARRKMQRSGRSK